MRAVNLIPSDARRRGGPSLSAGLPFIGLTAVLVLALVATVLYVTAHNRVSSRRAQLARTQSSLVRWTAAAGSYAHDVSVSSARQSVIGQVEVLAGARYDWSVLLGRLGDEMPRQSAVSSLTVAPAGSAAPAASTSSSPAPAASTSSSAGTPAATATNASSIAVSACAESQSVIAQTMQNLRRIPGISQVILGASSAGGAGSSGGGASGSCPGKWWTFSLTLGFAPPPAANPAPAQADTAAASDPASTSSSGGTQ